MHRPRGINRVIEGIIFFLFLVYPIFLRAEISKEEKLLRTTQKLLANPQTRKKGLKLLSSLTREKDKSISYRAKARLGAMHREDGKVDKSLKLVGELSDFNKFSQYKTDSKEKSAFVELFLESAHCNYSRKKVRESLKMLDYAEQHTEGIDKIRTFIKYGEILFASNDLDRADRYLDDAQNYSKEYFKPKKGEGSEDAKPVLGTEDGVDLLKLIDRLKLGIEFARLAKEYGEGYALYFKMRTFYDEKNYFEAYPIAEKLKNEFPDSVYGDAGRFYWCKMLIPNDFAGNLKDKSLPSGQKELHKFIIDKPYGYWRGEAWMELGRIELEEKWNGDKAAEYYNKALAWFRYVREVKDKTDLYSLPPKVKIKADPGPNMVSLDQWNRTVYNELSKYAILNRETAPWYINEREKDCLFMVGFFKFNEKKFIDAKECFIKASRLNKDIAYLEQKNFPNAVLRLRGACDQKYFIAHTSELKGFKKKNYLKINTADLKYILEKFKESRTIYESILNDPSSNDAEKAYALVGIGNCLRLDGNKKEAALGLYSTAFEKFPKTAAAAHAMLSYAYVASYCNDLKLRKKAPDLFLKCFQRYPDTIFGEEALARHIANSSNTATARRYASLYRKKYENGNFIKLVEASLKK